MRRLLQSISFIGFSVSIFSSVTAQAAFANEPADVVVNQARFITVGAEPQTHAATKYFFYEPSSVRAYTATNLTPAWDQVTCIAGTSDIKFPEANDWFTGMNGQSLDAVSWIPVSVGGTLPTHMSAANIILKSTTRFVLNKKSKISKSENRPCNEWGTIVDADGMIQQVCKSYGAPTSFTIRLNLPLALSATLQSPYSVNCALNTRDAKRDSIRFDELSEALAQSLTFHF